MADKQNLPPLKPPKFDIKKTVGYQKRIKEIGGRPTRNVYDYPTVFTRDNYTHTTPPQYQEETAAGLENYDKLTQAERTLYGWLPGFAESSVGKALERFSGGWLGKALSWIDVAVEGVERTHGLGVQYRNATFGMFRPDGTRSPDWNGAELDDLNRNLASAWYAGGLLADMSNLPTFQSDETGKLTGIQLPTDLPETAGLGAARKKKTAFTAEGRNPGAALVQTRAEYYDDLGALAIRAQLYDTYYHILLDPLNVIGAALKPVEIANVARRTIQSTKWADDVLDVGRSANALMKAGKFVEAADAFEKAKLFTDVERAAVRAGDAAEVARLASVIDEARGITRADKMVLMLTGGTDPFSVPTTKFGKFLNRANPFALTPASRAHELATVVSDNVGAYILSKYDDVAEAPYGIANDFHRAAMGAVGDDLGHAFVTQEGRAVQGILGGFTAHADARLAQYHLLAGERQSLESIATALNKTPEGVLDDILSGNSQIIAQKVGMSVDYLDVLGKTLKDMPSTPALFKYMLHNDLIDEAARQGVLMFGVKQRGFAQKLSQAMKSAESLAFLRLNPAYLIKNVINNEATMIDRGLGGPVPMREVDKFIKDVLNFEPYRMGQGFGAMGEAIPGLALKEGTTVIEEALREIGRASCR